MASKHYLWMMRPYFRQVAGQLALGSAAGVLMNTTIVLPAVLLGRAIDAALAFGRGETAVSVVVWAAIALIGGTAATEAPRVFKRYWLNTARARIRASVRADAYRGVLAWPVDRLHKTPVGDLMARINGDVEVLGQGVGEFIVETWDTVLYTISFVVVMFVYDPGLAFWALLPVPAAMLLAQVTGRWVGQRTAAAREANSSLITSLQEQLTAVRLLRSAGRTGAATDRVSALSAKQAERNLAVTRLRTGLQPVYGTLMTAGVVFIIWMGSGRVLSGAMTIGALVAFLQLFAKVVQRGPRIPQMLNSIQSGGAAYARLRPLLAPALSVTGEPRFSSFRPNMINGMRPQDGAKPTRAWSPVPAQLDAVTFSYPGNPMPVLSGVSLRVAAGSVIAVTGPVGSGKSALAAALTGLYPIRSGRVLVDGNEIGPASVPPTGLVGVLTQDPMLFSGTVRENILLSFEEGKGSPAMDLALQRITRVTALDRDLASFPLGLDTPIGEMGIRISGGQRQRIALARALAVALPHAPGLLVLDDPFSAVDVDTEAAIIKGLRETFGPEAPAGHRSTIVLCSHRLAAFVEADLVVVLDGGKIAEMGPHGDLMKLGGLYATIYEAQRQVDRTPAALKGVRDG